jgi:anti-anti-sigma factor
MLAGDIDLSSAPGLRKTLEGWQIASARFDLSRVTFIDSTGLHLLIGLRREFGPLQIIAESPSVERLLDLTGVRPFLMGPPVVESDGDRGRVRVLEGRVQ